MQIGSINNVDTLKEGQKKDNLMDIDKDDDYQKDEADEYIRLASESEIAIEEKNNLIEIFDNLKDLLNKHENKPKNINEVYEIYLENEVITKSHVRKQASELLLKFMFFVEGPLYGTIFLIGIFQMKSLMNALSQLINNSISSYYECYAKSNCNITISNNGDNIYDFYDYYYNYTMNETIDFNLMMITGFLGSLILKWKGFKISSFLLSLFNFGSIIWLLNFNFNFNKDGIFDYDILKIINLIFIYILLLCGIGGSALLSHQILVESHLKYKDHLIKKIKKELDKIKSKEKEEEEKKDLKKKLINNNKKTKLLKSTNALIEKNSVEKTDSKLLLTKTFVPNKSIKDLIELREEKKQKKLEDKIKEKEKTKFDFFFMICLTTIIGYLGKYSFNLFLDFLLTQIYGNNYDKRLFLIYIMILYALSILFSIIFYQLYKMSIFEYDEKEEEKNKTIKISQICGYIIYSEKRKITDKIGKNCCILCCESIQNCCNETCCNVLRLCDICDCYPKCSCSKCKYDTRDYNKKEEVFRYCYKTQRKSFWCNKFMTNKTQKKIFPYMIEYFILQLTTIGFEKQYEKYKNQNTHRKTWIAIFISTFILFFYFTLSFTRIVLQDQEIIDKDDKEKIRIII